MTPIKLVIQSGILRVKTLAESFITLTGIKGVKNNGGAISSGILDATIQEIYEDAQWFTDNATFVLKSGQKANLLQTGTWKIGDGVTTLSALSFLGGGGGLSGLTTNTIPKATSASAIGNSNITDDGTTVTVNSSFRATAGSGDTDLKANGTNITAEVYSASGKHEVATNNTTFTITNNPLAARKNEFASTESLFLDVPNLNLPQLTASKIVETDASKNLVSSGYSVSDILSIIDGTLKAPEAYDPTITSLFPTTYGGNAIEKGDSFRISVAGSMNGVTVNPEDLLIADTDLPGQTITNWQIVESNRDQATETVKGVAKIVTQAIIEDTATTNDTDIITAKKYWLGWEKIKTLTAQVITQIWEFLGVDLTPQTAPTYKRGRVWYDSTVDALSYYDDISGTSIQVGQENITRARNNTGSTILNGQAVYVSGALGQNPTIALAKADAELTSFLVGLATHDIANNTIGKVTIIGLVNDIDTSSFVDGDKIYVSATTAGALTSTPPSTPNYSVSVGVVLHSHVTQGKILVRPELPISTNTSLGTSDKIAPSQKAVKTYVDSLTSRLTTQSFAYTGASFTISNSIQYIFSLRLSNGIVLDETDVLDITISGTTVTVTNPSFGSGDTFYIKYLAQ